MFESPLRLTWVGAFPGPERMRPGAFLVSDRPGLSVSWVLDFDTLHDDEAGSADSGCGRKVLNDGASAFLGVDRDLDDVEASGNHEFMVSWFHLELERAEPREGVDLPIQGDDALHQRSAEHESWAAHPQFEPREAVGFDGRVSALDMAQVALVVGDERRAAVEARLDPRLELAAAARAVPGLWAFSDLGHVKRTGLVEARVGG